MGRLGDKVPTTVVIPSSLDVSREQPGGTETYIRNLSRQLVKRGVATIVLGWGKRTDLPGEVSFISLGDQGRSEIQTILALFLRRKQYIGQIPEKSIILGNAEHHCLPFIFPRKSFRVILIAHGAVAPTLRERKSRIQAALYRIFVERVVIRHVDRLVAVNTGALRYYQQRYPLLGSALTHLPIGVDISIFRPLDRAEVRRRHGFGPQTKVLLYVGRLAPEKRLHLLLQAFRALRQNRNDVKLVVVGDGPERENLHDFARRIDLKDCTFLGSRPRAEIPEIMNCADVFVLTSVIEEMPTVVLEAFACGVPVVSTAVGDVPRFVVDGKTGFLVGEDPVEICGGIRKALEVGPLVRSECLKVAELYGWDTLAGEIVAMIQEVAPDG